MSLISWHSGRLKRVGRSSSTAEIQAATDGDDEAFDVRFCLKEFCLGSLMWKTGKQKQNKLLLLWWWTVVVCTTFLARASFSCLGLKEKKSGMDGLALKRSLDECGTVIRWCHSAAQEGDVVTKSL